jgi:hypothetical protein
MSRVCFIIIFSLLTCLAFGQKKIKKSKKNKTLVNEFVVPQQNVDLESCLIEKGGVYNLIINIICENDGSIDFASIMLEFPLGYKVSFKHFGESKVNKRTSKTLKVNWKDFPDDKNVKLEFTLRAKDNQPVKITEDKITGKFAYLWLEKYTNVRPFIVKNKCE